MLLCLASKGQEEPSTMYSTKLILSGAVSSALLIFSLHAQYPDIPKSKNLEKPSNLLRPPMESPEALPEAVPGIRENEEIISSEPIETDAQKIENTLKEMIDALKSLDISKAYYAYTSKLFRKATPFENFKF